VGHGPAWQSIALWHEAIDNLVDVSLSLFSHHLIILQFKGIII
jgi:hypothetical protein